MLRAWLVASCLLAGCSDILGLKKLDQVPPLPDAALYCYVPTIDASVGSDPDIDNVTSENDNCPTTANKDQADEDGDCLGDACDMCAWDARSNSGLDDDNDTIGNECDPNAAITQVYFFEPFNDAASASAHFPQRSLNGAWLIDNGAWTHATPSGVMWATDQDSATTFGTAYVGFRISDMSLLNNNNFMIGAWVVAYGDMTGLAGVRAGLARDPDGLWLRIQAVSLGVATTIGQHAVAAGTIPGPQIRMSLGYAGPMFQARLETTNGTIMAEATHPSVSAGFPGLFTVDTVARFDYYVHVY